MTHLNISFNRILKYRATSVVPEPKKQKLQLWSEWNENDINSEKWEVGGKIKDSKAKPTSAPVIYMLYLNW